MFREVALTAQHRDGDCSEEADMIHHVGKLERQEHAGIK